MSRAWLLGIVALTGCEGHGGTVPVAEPGLREGAEEERPGLDACADLLVRCVDLGVSDDIALRAFDECLSANVRDGEEPERDDEDGRDDGGERDGDAPDRDGDDAGRGGDEGERDGEGDPER